MPCTLYKLPQALGGSDFDLVIKSFVMIDCLRHVAGSLQMPTVDVRIAAKVFVPMLVIQAGVEIAGVIMKTSLVPQVRGRCFFFKSTPRTPRKLELCS
jgi:hypothetical protein